MLVERDRDEAIDVGDEDDVDHRRGNSNGCDAFSPTAWRSLKMMYYSILNKDIMLHPRLVVANMNNRIFIGIYFYPDAMCLDGTPFAAVRPYEFHASITTAYFREHIAWRQIDAAVALQVWRRAVVHDAMTSTMDRFWTTVFPQLDYVGAFVWPPAPYKGYNISPNTRLGRSLILLQEFSEHVVQYDYAESLRLRTRRAIHVAWN